MARADWQYIPTDALDDVKRRDAATAWGDQARARLVSDWADAARAQISALGERYGVSAAPDYPGQLPDGDPAQDGRAPAEVDWSKVLGSSGRSLDDTPPDAAPDYPGQLPDDGVYRAPLGPGRPTEAPGTPTDQPEPDPTGGLIGRAARAVGDQAASAAADRRAFLERGAALVEARSRGASVSDADLAEGLALAEQHAVLSPEPLRAVGRTQAARAAREAKDALERAAGTAEQAAELRPPKPGYAENIGGIEDADHRDRYVADLLAANRAAGQRRGVVTDPRHTENARRLAETWTIEDILATKPGTAFNDTQMQVVGDTLKQTSSDLDKLRAKMATAVDDGTANDILRLQVAEKGLEEAALAAILSGARSEAGRALRSVRLALTGDAAARGAAIKEAWAALGTDRAAFDEWVKAWNNLDPSDTVGRYKMVRGLSETGWLEKVAAWTTSNMLSGPRTIAVNLVGGGLETLNRPLITLLEGRPREAVTDLGAMGRAFGVAFANAKTSFVEGVSPRRAAEMFETGQLDRVRPDAFPGKQGLVATPALRVLGATDEFVRTINHAGALAAAARREARKTGRTEADLLADPTEWMLTHAKKAEDHAVFAGKGTWLGRKLVEGRNLIRSSDPAERAIGIGFYILTPFVRVPEEILIRGTKMTLGPVVYPLRAARLAATGRADEARTAAAKAALSTASAIFIMSQVQDGNITGDGPSSGDKKSLLMAARDAEGRPVWAPHSIRVGGRWFDYTNLGPIALQLATMASAYEAAIDEGREPDATTMKQLKEIADRVGKVMLDASYIRTLGDVAKAVGEGRLSDIPGELGNNTLSRLVPYGGAVATAAQIVDDRVTDARNPLESTAARIPWAKSFVPGRVDPYGEPQRRPQDALAVLSPFRTEGAGPPDPVSSEVARLIQAGHRVPVRVRRRNDQYADADQTRDQQSLIATTAGKAARAYLAYQIADPAYEKLPDTAKAATLAKSLQAAYEIADLSLGENVARSPRRAALMALAATPQYERVGGTPSEIRFANFQISEARAKLAEFKRLYGADVGETILRREDKQAWALAQRKPLDSATLRRIRAVVDKQFGGALTTAASTALPGAGNTIVPVGGAR